MTANGAAAPATSTAGPRSAPPGSPTARHDRRRDHRPGQLPAGLAEGTRAGRGVHRGQPVPRSARRDLLRSVSTLDRTDDDLVAAAQPRRRRGDGPAAPTPLRPGPRRLSSHRGRHPRRRRRRPGGDDPDRPQHRQLRRAIGVRHLGLPHRHEHGARRTPQAQAAPATPAWSTTTATRRSRPTSSPTATSTTSPTASRSTPRSPISPRSSRPPSCMRDVGDLDYAEIAAALDIPVGTVKSRIARGRRLLVEKLGNQDPPSERPTHEPPNNP